MKSIRARQVLLSAVTGIALSLTTVGVLWIVGNAATANERGSLQTESSASNKAVVLIAYYSRTGNTEKLARAVEKGAKTIRGVEVMLKKVDQVTKKDLQEADGIILGCPTYFANIPGEMKTVIDRWNWHWKVDFTDKIGGAFSTGGGQMGGKEHVVISLLLFMINNRMIVAGPLYEDESGEDIWGEIGASAMTGPIDPGISSKELDGAIRLGRRIADLAVRLKQLRQ